MKTNPARTHCVLCGNPIAANAGIVSDSGPMHLICRSNRAASVIATHLDSGAVLLRNADGPCADAPCCGCCGEVPAIADGEAVRILTMMATITPADPVDATELPVADYVHGLEVKIPDGIDVTPGRNLADLEIEAEALLEVEKKTDGQWCLVAHQERDGIVLTLWQE